MEKIEKTEKLIAALKLEQAAFEKKGYNTLEHHVAIEYLVNGKTDEDPDEFELLDACMYDFDTVCYDYGVI